ncbi:MAG: class I SAM-dependent methyltransferase [Acidobacteria bacterium]|jgi:SAM-dependent methyltransferase|nr:class I SAM-dependent methyltransferase [Acidobacteriota bacterium]
MSAPPSQPARAADFEFAALQSAVHYRAAVLAEFRSRLRGSVLEAGAGAGQFTALLLRQPGITGLVALEPDPRFAERLRGLFPRLELIQGTITSVPADRPFDAILSVNVLEHIPGDGQELAAYRARLAGRHGALCLFVPARPEIFGTIDRDFGHCRRYRRGELRAKLEGAGFRVERLSYFNLAGYFAWWWNFRLLRRHGLDPVAVRFFDRFVFPLQHALESRLLRPPLGQSLIAVAVAG